MSTELELRPTQAQEKSRASRATHRPELTEPNTSVRGGNQQLELTRTPAIDRRIHAENNARPRC
jgi:hypothetical protein